VIGVNPGSQGESDNDSSDDNRLCRGPVCDRHVGPQPRVGPDEQYIRDYDPRVTVLANALYKGKTMPVMWTKPWGKGRVFYLALGHDPKACEQEMFTKLLIRGGQWAACQPVIDPK